MVDFFEHPLNISSRFFRPDHRRLHLVTSFQVQVSEFSFLIYHAYALHDSAWTPDVILSGFKDRITGVRQPSTTFLLYYTMVWLVSFHRLAGLADFHSRWLRSIICAERILRIAFSVLSPQHHTSSAAGDLTQGSTMLQKATWLSVCYTQQNTLLNTTLDTFQLVELLSRLTCETNFPHTSCHFCLPNSP